MKHDTYLGQAAQHEEKVSMGPENIKIEGRTMAFKSICACVEI